MKNLLACLAVFAAITAGAQSMPYNPDANDDGYIGSPDLLSFLPLFGSQVGIDSSLTCDYDGTPLEDLFSGLLDGTIELDSLLIQYHLIDSVEIFAPGCPDPYLEIFEYERAVMLYPWSFDPLNAVVVGNHLYGYFHAIELYYNASNGKYQVSYANYELAPFQADGIFLSGNCCSGYSTLSGYLPFPSNWTLSESGIELPWGSSLGYATYLDILPYWHYAE